MPNALKNRSEEGKGLSNAQLVVWRECVCVRMYDYWIISVKVYLRDCVRLIACSYVHAGFSESDHNTF